ncbi:hypothetical protein BX666DRAFT_74224 [Dichotomocladium elegans]|nr:hypothetical protein BX666DRAFT_74224 [Dichotomocladium elegans]
MTTSQQHDGVNESLPQSVRTGSESPKIQSIQQTSFEVEFVPRRSIQDDERSNTIPAEDEIDPEKPNDAVGGKQADQIPDGGYGWLIVIGAFLVQITSYGVMTSCPVYNNDIPHSSA